SLVSGSAQAVSPALSLFGGFPQTDDSRSSPAGMNFFDLQFTRRVNHQSGGQLSGLARLMSRNEDSPSCVLHRNDSVVVRNCSHDASSLVSVSMWGIPPHSIAAGRLTVKRCDAVVIFHSRDLNRRPPCPECRGAPIPAFPDSEPRTWKLATSRTIL